MGLASASIFEYLEISREVQGIFGELVQRTYAEHTWDTAKLMIVSGLRKMRALVRVRE